MVLSRWISYLFHPILMPTLGLALILSLDSYLKFTVQPAMKIYLYIILVVNTIVFPILILGLLKFRGVIKSFHLSERKDRLIPFGVTCIFYGFSYNIMQKSALPPIVLSVFLGMTLSVFLTFALTFFTKISVHMVGVSGVLGAVIALYMKFAADYRIEIAALVLLWGLIGFARLHLKAHNLPQIIIGTLVGFASVFSITLVGVMI
ncbi:MAG: hypothetical protein ACPGEG_03045 [Salibacteraceae bacterium]